MHLKDLLKPWIATTEDCAIVNLQNDSRKVQPGDAFIAYKGTITDGRLYIQKAKEAGAVAIIYDPEDLTVDLPDNMPCISLNNLEEKLAELACRFYQSEKSALQISAVTGTNGKTTIAYQLAQAHARLQHKSAYIGTLGQGDITALQVLENTTPDALRLQQLLHEYAQKKVEHVCMEVSSHALSLHRVDGIDFNQAIFTNLTQDHLDFHKTMENYADSKATLFSWPALEWAILNKDDAWFTHMRKAVNPVAQVLTYGLQQDCDLWCRQSHTDINGTHMTVESPWGQHEILLNALGKFNIYNGLAVFSSLLAAGYEPKAVVEVMQKLKPAPGRMELVSQNPRVLVDYAHTPDAMENALATLHTIKKEGKLWVVFGCGGDRDKTKRPLMGKAAGLYADEVVVTSDNPRTESPESIMADILSGIDASASVHRIIERKEAILYVLQNAEPKDIILISGKGHENYQQIGHVKRFFSDQGIVREYLKNHHENHEA